MEGLLEEMGLELEEGLLDPKTGGEGPEARLAALDGVVMSEGARGLLKKVEGAAFWEMVADGELAAGCVGFVSEKVTGAIEGLKEVNPPLRGEGMKALLIVMNGVVGWAVKAGP